MDCEYIKFVVGPQKHAFLCLKQQFIEASPVIETMFSTRWSQSPGGQITCFEESTEPRVFDIFSKVITDGRDIDSAEDALQVFVLADKYDVKVVFDKIQRSLLIHRFTLQDLIENFKLAREHPRSLHTMLDESSAILARELNVIINLPEIWAQLDADMLARVISKDNISIPEEEILAFVWRWLISKREPAVECSGKNYSIACYDESFSKVIRSIRFQNLLIRNDIGRRIFLQTRACFVFKNFLHKLLQISNCNFCCPNENGRVYHYEPMLKKRAYKYICMFRENGPQKETTTIGSTIKEKIPNVIPNSFRLNLDMGNEIPGWTIFRNMKIASLFLKGPERMLTDTAMVYIYVRSPFYRTVFETKAQVKKGIQTELNVVPPMPILPEEIVILVKFETNLDTAGPDSFTNYEFDWEYSLSCKFPSMNDLRLTASFYPLVLEEGGVFVQENGTFQFGPNMVIRGIKVVCNYPRDDDERRNE